MYVPLGLGSAAYHVQRRCHTGVKRYKDALMINNIMPAAVNTKAVGVITFK